MTTTPSDDDFLGPVDLPIRPRRNRRTAAIRGLVRETRLSPESFIMPVFVVDGENQRIPISAMPGCHRFSVDELLVEARLAQSLGVNALALFPALSESQKDKRASESTNPDGLCQRAIREIKSSLPGMIVVTDVAMDPYSSDGHDGLVEDGQILNDETLEILACMAVSQAEAGADIVAPSDMMDGRIGYIRDALDLEGFTDVGILAYSAKYASAFYGPFREALDSAPKAGDKKTYQMDPANATEAIREVLLDVEEGADMVMVKPGLPYLDIIRRVKDAVEVPVAAYHVSGEFAMIKAAAERGWLDGEAAMFEAHIALKRAGADIILTYNAIDMAKILQS